MPIQRTGFAGAQVGSVNPQINTNFDIGTGSAASSTSTLQQSAYPANYTFDTPDDLALQELMEPPLVPPAPVVPHLLATGTPTFATAPFTVAVPTNVPGDLLLCMSASATAPVSFSTGAWNILIQAINVAGGLRATILGKLATASEPATYSSSAAIAGNAMTVQIVNYGPAVPSVPAPSAAGGATQQAPSIPTYLASTRVLEAYFDVAFLGMSITTNINSPTVQSSLSSANGSIFLIDYLQVSTQAATTGDSVGTDNVNGICAFTLGLSA